MTTREAATEYRMAQCAQAMQERVASGESIDEFCTNRSVSRNTYFYWQRKLREAACQALLPAAAVDAQSVVPAGWAVCEEAVVESPAITPEEGSLSISIGAFRVNVGVGVDPDRLATVCRVLVSLC